MKPPQNETQQRHAESVWNRVEAPLQASEADMGAEKPRYGTEMRGRFRGGGAETVSADTLPVSLRVAFGLMSGSR